MNKVTRGINDPDNLLRFTSIKDVIQARKYIKDFQGGLLWIVNVRELVYKYDYFSGRMGFQAFASST